LTILTVENEVDRLAVLSDVNLLSNEFLVLLEKLGAELDISGFLRIEVSILWIKRDGFEGENYVDSVNVAYIVK
jgi:hypothetical protein